MTTTDALRQCRRALYHANLHSITASDKALTEGHAETAAAIAGLTHAIASIRQALHMLTVRHANRKQPQHPPMDPTAAEHRDTRD